MVLPGIDEELDEAKRLYEGIHDFLSKVARDIAENIPRDLPNDLNVIYFPQIGFLITMPMDQETGQVPWEGSEFDIWEKMFSTDAVVYYKNDRMKQMDTRFGDIHGQICGKNTNSYICSTNTELCCRQGN